LSTKVLVSLQIKKEQEKQDLQEVEYSKIQRKTIQNLEAMRQTIKQSNQNTCIIPFN